MTTLPTATEDRAATTTAVTAPWEERDALAERLFGAVVGLIDLHTIYIGDRLGLYRALADGGPANSVELAARTGTRERYVREWLEQQAITGILQVEDPEAAPAERQFRLPAGHAEVLLDQDSLAYLAPLARQAVGVGKPIAAVLEAFRVGGGVPYQAYGTDLREGQADLSRATFLNLLGTEWIPAIPDLDARLKAAPPARVADVGCGGGWSSITIARAYPLTQVVGFDSDAASIALARQNAATAGLSDRVRFEVRDAATLSPAADGRYDLVFVFEAIHDMSRPVEALRAMRGLAGDQGTVLVVDERVADAFAPPGNEIERFLHGASVLFCLPTGMADQPSAGTGTIMRTDTFRRYAEEAGYQAVTILPIEHDFYRFYRLTP